MWEASREASWVVDELERSRARMGVVVVAMRWEDLRASEAMASDGGGRVVS